MWLWGYSDVYLVGGWVVWWWAVVVEGGLIAMDNDLCDLVAPPLVGPCGYMF